MIHSHVDVQISHDHIYQKVTQWTYSSDNRGNSGGNAVHKTNGVNVGGGTESDTAQNTGAEFQTNDANFGGLVSGKLDVSNTDICNNDITLNTNNVTYSATGNNAGAISSTYAGDGFDVSLEQVTLVPSDDANAGLTVNSTELSNHNMAMNTTPSSFSSSFTFDTSNLKCIQIFYYIRAK